MSWGAIFAGAFIAVGVWALLLALGFALGFSSVEPGDPIRGEALFTGIWALICPLLALFVGGAVAAWMAGAYDGITGALHGGVVWAVTLVLGAFALTSLLGAITGAATSSIRGLASAASAAKPGQIAGALDVGSSELLGPVNQKLQAQGKPPVTAEQLQQAAQRAVSASLQQGSLNQEVLTTSLAQETNLSREDVSELAATIGSQVSGAGAQVEQAAVSAAEATGKVMWGLFFALLLGLCSAILGAIAGNRSYSRRHHPAAPVLRRAST